MLKLLGIRSTNTNDCMAGFARWNKLLTPRWLDECFEDKFVAIALS